MTVSTIYAPIEYAGDAETVAFPVPWMFLEADDLRLTKINDSTDAETDVTTFTATGVGEPTGGTVILPAAIPGYTLRIARRTDRTQEMDLQPQGRFPAETVERSVDKLTLIVQELEESIGTGGTGSGTPVTTIETDDPSTLEIIKTGPVYKLNVLGSGPTGPAGGDLAGTYPDPILKQGTGVGSLLLEVETDFSWAGWAGGSTLGGRGIAAGYAWFGDPGSQVHLPVWGANDAYAIIRWSRDFWATTVQDSSLAGIIGVGVLDVKPPCMAYVEIGGVWCWVLTSDSDGRWWYAQDIAANYNANGSLKTSAWVAGTTATRVMADIAQSTLEGATCMVGNHGYIIRTTDWATWTDVYNTGGSVLGGIATDNDGTWIAVKRDTGAVFRSTDAGQTWTQITLYKRTGETGGYSSSASLIPAGTVLHGNGMWLVTGATSYAYSPDGLYWTVENSALGTFYGVGFDGVRYFATNPNNGTDPAIIYQLLVSSIPFHRQVVAERGLVVGGDTYLKDLPNVQRLGTDQNGKTIDSGFSDGPVVDVRDFPGWTPGPSGTDNYAALQGAIDQCPVGGVVHVPMPTPDGSGVFQPYRISQGLHIDKRMAIRGVGVGTTRELIRIQPAAGIPSIDFLLKVGHKPTSTNDRIVGGLIENLTLYGGGAIINDALFVGMNAQNFHTNRFSVDSGRGRGVRAQCWWDSIWDRFYMENCNTAQYGPRLGDCMFLLDIGWDDIPGGEPAAFFNVNNFFIRSGHIEQLNGTVFKSVSGANVDCFDIGARTKIENSGMPGNTDETLFDFTGVTRASITDCTIHRINPTYGYLTILKTPSPGVVEMARNKLYEMEAATVLADISGFASPRIKDNTSWNCGGANPIILNTSSRSVLVEYPQNGDIPAGASKENRSRTVFGPFRSMHQMMNLSGAYGFVADTSGQEVAATEKTVFSVNGAASAICTINPYTIIQSPVAVRIGVRCRTTSGSGALDLVVPSGGSERSYGERTISSTYSVVSWTISAGALGLVNISRNVKLNTGAANAATIYIDGIYVEPLGHSYDSGLTWDPGSIVSGASGESPDITLPDAIVGDHVSVYPPESYVIPAGVFLSARVTAANTCRIQILNVSGGSVDLASGVWQVRLNKFGYARA